MPAEKGPEDKGDIRGSKQLDIKGSVKASVAFAQAVRIILVPSRNEYRKSGLQHALWWEAAEFSQFQTTAITEIRAFALEKGIAARAARRKLYQPAPRDLDYGLKSYQISLAHVNRPAATTNSVSESPDPNSNLPSWKQDRSVQGSDQRLIKTEKCDVGSSLPSRDASNQDIATNILDKPLKGIMRVRHNPYMQEHLLHLAEYLNSDIDDDAEISSSQLANLCCSPSAQKYLMDIHTGTLNALSNGSEPLPTNSEASCYSPKRQLSSNHDNPCTGTLGQHNDLLMEYNDNDSSLSDVSQSNSPRQSLTPERHVSRESNMTTGSDQSSPASADTMGRISAISTAGRTPPASVPSSPVRNTTSLFSFDSSVSSASDQSATSSNLEENTLPPIQPTLEALQNKCIPVLRPLVPMDTSDLQAQEDVAAAEATAADLDLYALPVLQRTNSLDLVKSMPRCPVPASTDEEAREELSASRTFWDSYRQHKNASSAPQSFAESELDTLTLCVPLDKPGKLRSESQPFNPAKYVSNFMGASFPLSDWPTSRLLAWVLIFITTIVMVLDLGAESGFLGKKVEL